MFSGGASLGVYHLGCLKALKELDLCPRIISGSSAGSIFASIICTRKFEDLDSLFDPHSVNYTCFKLKEKEFNSIIGRYLKDSVFLDITAIQKFLKGQFGDLTFEEAYENTGWVLNVTVTSIHEKDAPRLLNYVTSPYVLIWSAVSAS